MDFKAAVEFCAIRKMEVLAFDTDFEMKDKRWTYERFLKKGLMLHEHIPSG